MSMQHPFIIYFQTIELFCCFLGFRGLISDEFLVWLFPSQFFFTKFVVSLSFSRIFLALYHTQKSIRCIKLKKQKRKKNEVSAPSASIPYFYGFSAYFLVTWKLNFRKNYVQLTVSKDCKMWLVFIFWIHSLFFVFDFRLGLIIYRPQGKFAQYIQGLHNEMKPSIMWKIYGKTSKRKRSNDKSCGHSNIWKLMTSQTAIS